MSGSAFYRECNCSLLSVRPHIVRSRAEWERHVIVQEQDRLNQLFESSSGISPGNPDRARNWCSSEPGTQKTRNTLRSSSSSDAPPTPEGELGSRCYRSPSIPDYQSPMVSDFRSPSIHDYHSPSDYRSPSSQVESAPESTGSVFQKVEPGSSRHLYHQYLTRSQELARDYDEEGHESRGMSIANSPLYRESSFDQEMGYRTGPRRSNQTGSAESSCSAGRRRGSLGRAGDNPSDDGDDDDDDDTDFDESSSAGGKEDLEDSFEYGSPRIEMSRQEIMSVAMHDLKITHRISRNACQDIKGLLEGFSSDSFWDYRTTKKWIEEETGVKAISYDCCKNSCMAFAMYPNKDACDYCQHPRWEGGLGGKSYATFEYIPIVHRIRLWCADNVRSAIMTTYRQQAELQGKLRIRSSTILTLYIPLTVSYMLTCTEQNTTLITGPVSSSTR